MCLTSSRCPAGRPARGERHTQRPASAGEVQTTRLSMGHALFWIPHLGDRGRLAVDPGRLLGIFSTSLPFSFSVLSCQPVSGTFLEPDPQAPPPVCLGSHVDRHDSS